jgi:hypothetical protein
VNEATRQHFGRYVTVASFLFSATRVAAYRIGKGCHTDDERQQADYFQQSHALITSSRKAAEEAQINKIEKSPSPVKWRTSGVGRKSEEANHHIKPETNTLKGRCRPSFFILA